MLYIGIDLGTSAVKLLLMDGEGEIKNIVSKDYPLEFPQPGWSQQNPEDWKKAVLEGIPQILDDPAPAVYLSEYQSSSIEYLTRLWTAADDYWTVYYALLEGVRESFARHGVEMTYDHLNVHIVEK